MLNSVLAFALAFLATSFIPYGVGQAVYDADGAAGSTPAQDRARLLVIGILLPLVVTAVCCYLLGVPALCGSVVAVIWCRIFL